MKMKYLKLTTLALALFMLIGSFAACKKDEAGGIQASDGTKQTTAAKTSAKSNVTSNTSSNTNAKTTNGQETSGKNDASSKAGSGSIENLPVASEDGKVEKVQDKGITEELFSDVEIDLKGQFAENNIDFGGRTIVYSAWNENAIPTDKEGTASDLVLKYLRIKEAEQKYNFKMEYRVIPNFNQYRDTIISEMVAGINFADIIKTQGILSFPTHVSQNLIVPLDDYIDFNSPIVMKNSYMCEGGYWNGKHYGITSAWETAYPRVFFNKDILDREGQPDILDYVEQDQWNWSTFLDVAINCTKDTNGDGIIDQWGISAVPSFASSLPTNMLFSNGVSCVAFKDGKAVYNLSSPAAQRALQFASDLNFIHKVYINDVTMDAPQYYMKGVVAMYLNAPSYNKNPLLSGMRSYLAPLPKGPDVSVYSNTYSSNFEAISAASKDPGDVAKVWMEISLFWDENGEPIKELEELNAKFPYDWKWSTSNPNRTYSTEREYNLSIKALYSNWQTDYALGYPTSLTTTIINNQVFQPIMKGSISVAQAISATQDSAQAIIDQYVK